MSTNLAIGSQDLVLQLRAFLEELDTARWKTELRPPAVRFVVESILLEHDFAQQFC